MPAGRAAAGTRRAQRVLFVDDGDIVMVDADRHAPADHADDRRRERARAGRATTRTSPTCATATSSSSRSTAAAPRCVRSSPTSRPKQAEPRLTDSQRFIRDEEEKLIEFVEKQKDEKKKAEDEAEEGQAAGARAAGSPDAPSDLMLSPDDTHVFVLVAERPAGAKNTIVPNYVTETGYTEDIPGRTNVGDTQDRRLLAVLNLKTGKTVVGRRQLRAAGRRRAEKPAAPAPTGAGRPAGPRRRSARSAGRCRSCPTTASSRSRRRGRPTTRIAGS